MKPPLVILVLIYCCVLSAQLRRNQTQSPTKSYLGSRPSHSHLTVDDVIPLAQAGISDDVIISQSQQKNGKFDFSADQIVRLRTSGLNNLTSRAILTPNSSAPTAPLPEATSSARPTNSHPPSVCPAATQSSLVSSAGLTKLPQILIFNQLSWARGLYSSGLPG